VLGALLVVAWIVLTGGLHLDGLMDTCDGVFGRADRARKLEIMKDSRVGSFGVLGGVCVLLLKFALLSSMSTRLLFPVLLIVPTVARWGILVAVRIFPAARTTGMGATFRQTLTTPRLLIGALIALLAVLLFGHFIGLLVWFGMILAALIVGTSVTQSLGGLTGDVYGAVAEVAEVVGLLLFLLLRFWF
jgi:adenosylcobinamide-GDP ribazoletransferase